MDPASGARGRGGLGLGPAPGYDEARRGEGRAVVRIPDASGGTRPPIDQAGALARCRCMAALRDRLTRPWRSISVTTTMISSPIWTTSSTVGTW